MAPRIPKQGATRKPKKDLTDSSTLTLVMTTPSVALSMTLSGAQPGQAVEAVAHDRLIDFVRALARDAARADHAASRRLAEGE